MYHTKMQCSAQACRFPTLVTDSAVHTWSQIEQRMDREHLANVFLELFVSFPGMCLLSFQTRETAFPPSCPRADK